MRFLVQGYDVQRQTIYRQRSLMGDVEVGTSASFIAISDHGRVNSPGPRPFDPKSPFSAGLERLYHRNTEESDTSTEMS